MSPKQTEGISKTVKKPVIIKKTESAAISWPDRVTTDTGEPPSRLFRGTYRRIGMVSLFYATAYFFAHFVSYSPKWIAAGTFRQDLLNFESIFAWLGISISLVVFLVVRYGKVPATRISDFGLIYMLLGTLCIAVPNFWGAYSSWSSVIEQQLTTWRIPQGIPWECPWIIMFPFVTRSIPGKTLVVSLVAASASPATLVISRGLGVTSLQFSLFDAIWYFLFTTYLAAGLGYFSSWILDRLGRDLKKARAIGSYELLDLIGRGGMGEVWRARHRMLARPAAIKLIRPEVLGSDLNSRANHIRRFEREAQATAALRSVHTIEVYDFGITKEGTFYYVMELLDGLDLESFVEQFGPLEADRTIYLLRQVCQSLCEAHDNGMIHRDIKPANIFVCRLGPASDFVKVLDFGLVKPAGHLQERATQLTRVGITCCTPAYFAPEMATNYARIDRRADLYALGCVAYWILTGQTVFPTGNELEMIAHHINTDPLPPSQRCELEIPESLDRVILSCLAKNPEQRPDSAAELDSLLASCDTKRVWSCENARDWWDLHMPAATPGFSSEPTTTSET